MQQLWNRYKEVILYLVFGVCTTLVNIIVYYLCAHPLGMKTVPGTCIAWAVSVLFAYITNKIWVFESRSRDMKEVLREMVSFVSCRIATGVLDLVIMYLCVDVMHMPDMWIKIASNVLVVVLNYLASKLFIFR